MQLNLKKEDVEKLHLAKDILEKDFKYHFTTGQLAQKVGTNDYKLKNGFKQLFRISLYKYLTTVRIEKAKYLLECTDLPVKRIARNFGFPDAPTFTKSFKRTTGMSPGQWRRNGKLKLAS